MSNKVDVLRKWVDALRSGQFHQIKKFYFGIEPNECCALGLLLKVIYAEKCGEVMERNLDTLSRFLPVEALECVVKGNDMGNSFKDLADWVEKNVIEGLAGEADAAGEVDGAG